MRNNEVISIEEASRTDSEIKEKIKDFHPRIQEEILVANEVLKSMSNDIFDFDSERRVRGAGYTLSEAESIAFVLRERNIQVGQVFSYGSKSLVLTPFKTVVPIQTYITCIQDRLFELTTVDQEIMVSQLKSQVREFTSLSFIGLIKLAFRNLFNNFKGEKNG